MTTNILPIDTQTPKMAEVVTPGQCFLLPYWYIWFFFDDCFIQHVSRCMLKVACAFCSSLNSNIAYTIIVLLISFVLYQNTHEDNKNLLLL